MVVEKPLFEFKDGKLRSYIPAHEHNIADITDLAAMTAAEGNTGTLVTNQLISAINLKSIILNHSPAGSRPASDVSAWAKSLTRPSYTYTDVGAKASD